MELTPLEVTDILIHELRSHPDHSLVFAEYTPFNTSKIIFHTSRGEMELIHDRHEYDPTESMEVVAHLFPRGRGVVEADVGTMCQYLTSLVLLSQKVNLTIYLTNKSSHVPSVYLFRRTFQGKYYT